MKRIFVFTGLALGWLILLPSASAQSKSPFAKANREYGEGTI